jgi:hypothetical protein
MSEGAFVKRAPVGAVAGELRLEKFRASELVSQPGAFGARLGQALARVQDFNGAVEHLAAAGRVGRAAGFGYEGTGPRSVDARLGARTL